MSLGGASFLAGLWGNAASNATNSPLQAFTLAGNYVAPTGLINWEQASGLFLIDQLDVGVYNNLRRFAGFQGTELSLENYRVSKVNQQGIGDWVSIPSDVGKHANDLFVKYSKAFPTITELNLMSNREVITDGLYQRMMLIQSMGEPGFAKAYSQLRFEVPGPSDLIRFAVRDCFDPNIVQTFQYNKELPSAILPFMKAQGYHGEIDIAMPVGSTTTSGNDPRVKPQWFDLYWWSHWDLPSVTQGYEMLHRLYINSDYGPAPGVTQEISFSSEDLSLLLKANDYPPFWRGRMEAISYNPLTRVDVRRMFDVYVATPNDVYHAYRAIGYNDANAKLLLQFTQKLRDDKETKKMRDSIFKSTYQSFLLGGLSEIDARKNLESIGYRMIQATALVNAWKSESTMTRLKDTLKYIKEGYLLGTFSNADVIAALQGVGILQPKITSYINLWEQIKRGKRKFLSGQTNMQHAIAGMISINMLRMKLVNLNFDEREIQQMIGFVVFSIQERQAKDLAKALAKAKQEADKNMQAMLKPYSDSNIKAMYKKGVLDNDDVYRILRLKGWRNDTILDWMYTFLSVDPSTVNAEEETTEASETTQTANP